MREVLARLMTGQLIPLVLASLRDSGKFFGSPDFLVDFNQEVHRCIQKTLAQMLIGGVVNSGGGWSIPIIHGTRYCFHCTAFDYGATLIVSAEKIDAGQNIFHEYDLHLADILPANLVELVRITDDNK